MSQELTKLEVARRQLATAIRMFFECADSISVYSLAQASWEILDALCKNQGLIRFREQMSDANSLSEHEIKNIASYGRNFFKHADRDPDGILDDFSDDRNDHALLGAVIDYGTLADTKPVEIQIFPIWYLSVYPEKAMRPEMNEIIAAGEILFPKIGTMVRREQKRLGLRVLDSALRDPTLMQHPSTDRSSVNSID